jgi:prophage tail gpP-like protein
MALDFQNELGAADDRVHLLVNGREFRNYTRYSVKTGVMQQPSGFSATFGAGMPGKDPMQLRDMLEVIYPGARFELKIGETLVQSGVIEDLDANDSGGGTELQVAGRDWMWPLVKNHIHYERDFGHPTYFELTKEVLKICGLGNRTLTGDNEAHIRSVSRSVKASARPAGEMVETIETNKLTTAGTKVNLQRTVAKIGGTWLDFLKSQYKKVGLFLWATADGNFVLAHPNAKKQAIYKIVKRRDIPRTMTATVSRSLQHHTSQRHAYSVCFGKGGGGAKSVHAMERMYPDTEMVWLGFNDVFVQYDEDCKTPLEAQHIADRAGVEWQREGWVLKYTVSGHTTPGLLDDGKMLIWTPDTMVQVIDEPLGDLFAPLSKIDPSYDAGKHKLFELSAFGSGQDMYIEDIDFQRTPHTQTTIRLMRPRDLDSLGELGDNEDAIPKSFEYGYKAR